MKQEHIDQINKAVAAVAAKKNINHFYFVACGGSQAFMMPAQFMFDKEIDIPAGIYTSNQFVHEEPKALGPDSVVITCSHSQYTRDSKGNRGCKSQRSNNHRIIQFSRFSTVESS